MACSRLVASTHSSGPYAAVAVLRDVSGCPERCWSFASRTGRRRQRHCWGHGRPGDRATWGHHGGRWRAEALQAQTRSTAEGVSRKFASDWHQREATRGSEHMLPQRDAVICRLIISCQLQHVPQRSRHGATCYRAHTHRCQPHRRPRNEAGGRPWWGRDPHARRWREPSCRRLRRQARRHFLLCKHTRQGACCGDCSAELRTSAAARHSNIDSSWRGQAARMLGERKQSQPGAGGTHWVA